MPEMIHSTAYDANVLQEYSLNSWDEASVLSRRQLSQPRNPVNGTIPRGFASMEATDGVYASAEEAVKSTLIQIRDRGPLPYTPNAAVPYYYPDTEEGRTLATEKIKYNPFPISKAGIAKGQELYNIYCGICHGDKGDGKGYLVRDGGKYPAQPAILTDSAFVNSSNGRFYHAIMYGKNAMGPHSDKLSFEERWQVIHYIRLLQAQAKKVNYNDEVNELNPAYGVPNVKAQALLPAAPAPQAQEPQVQQDSHNH